MDAVNALLDIEVSPDPKLFLLVFRIHFGLKLSIRIRSLQFTSMPLRIISLEIKSLYFLCPFSSLILIAISSKFCQVWNILM